MFSKLRRWAGPTPLPPKLSLEENNQKAEIIIYEVHRTRALHDDLQWAIAVVKKHDELLAEVDKFWER